jgi:hypothetical protein
VSGVSVPEDCANKTLDASSSMYLTLIY